MLRFPSLQVVMQGVVFVSLISVGSNSIAATIDGNLADLMSEINSSSYNAASGTETGDDAENNGFDITNTYARYDVANDTFFLGMSMFGQVGTSGGDEGDSFATDPFMGWLQNPSAADLFDPNETYGFNILKSGDAEAGVSLTLTGDGFLDNGAGMEVSSLFGTSTSGISVNWAVSEFYNGVEFSVTGLYGNGYLGDFSFANPTDVDINFFAGSISNPLGEDVASLNMQVVPVPAAAWLFISGFVGLATIARRRQ